MIFDNTVLEQRKNHEKVEWFLKKERFKPVPLLELSKKLGLPQSEIKSACESLIGENRILTWEDRAVFHNNSYEKLKEEIREKLWKFHEKNPLRRDVSQEEIRSKISSSIELRLFEKVLQDLLKGGEIALYQGKIKIHGFQRRLNPGQKLIYDKFDEVCKSYGFRPLPSNVLKKIQESYGEKEVKAVLKLMVGEGRLVKLNNGRLVHSESIEKIKKILKDYITKKGQVALAESV